MASDASAVFPICATFVKVLESGGSGRFEEVMKGLCDFGIVPIENSSEGSVNLTLDCLMEFDLTICGEIEMRIEHNLIGYNKPMPKEGIEIHAHEQALAQCKDWLTSYCPGAKLVPVSSNSQAAINAAENKGVLAIAGKNAAKKYNLDMGKNPQQYGIGFKEIWEVSDEQHQEGLVMHTAGWPLDNKTYGGSFVYHAEKKQIYIGYVIGLDYQNPHLSPFDEFQRFKTHKDIKKMLEGGKRIAFGARALIEGGLQSLPKMYMPGGLLIGCDAGTLNMPKIKGSHLSLIHI